MRRSTAIGLAAFSVGLTAGVPVVAWQLEARAASKTIQPQKASGFVFLDSNQNGRRDPGERGLAGVEISDQSQIVSTDRDGRWELPVESDEDTTYFVVKPRGYMTPVDGDQLPRFYYIHKPKGSPKQKYPGVEPTGPLPASIDFPLVPSK